MTGAEAIVSALSYLALALLLGQLVVAGFLLPNDAPIGVRSAMLTGADLSLWVFLGAAVLALIVQGAKLQRGFPVPELLWRYVTLTQSGNIWLARELYAGALAIGLHSAARRGGSVNSTRWLAAMALPLVAARSFTSHAVAVGDDAAIAISSDALHLVVSALWAGGLLALWRALRRAAGQKDLWLGWTGKLIRRFSGVALGSVTILVITGLYQSYIQVGELTTLVSTDYGKVLLVKIALFSAMLSYGALNFFSIRRRSVHLPSDRTLRRIASESVIGLTIFGVTGLLTTLPPGVHALHQKAAAAQAPQTVMARAKIYQPAEGASVKIVEPKNGTVVTTDQLPLKFILHAGRRGHHVHAYVDGELMGMFQSRSGTLNGLKPGHHTLELRVVAADHQSELNAYDRVEFTVK